MLPEADSWDDLPRDLLADWTPDPEPEEPFHSTSSGTNDPANGNLPRRLSEGWSNADEIPFPEGPTALCHAFALRRPDSHSGGPDAESLRPLAGPDRLARGEIEPSGSRSIDAGQDGTPSQRLPQVGDVVKGFQLRLELGRGAFARVYLAEEINLGHRLVALKISRAEGEEPQILARLQHPHIVPVHSVHDDPGTGLRLLCMPFLGGTNLAQLLQEAPGMARDQATGKSLMDALDQLSQRLPFAICQEGSYGPLLRSRASRARGARSRSLSIATERDASRQGEVGEPGRNDHQPCPSRGRFRSLVSRLVARPVSPTELNDDDYGRPSRQFLRGANGIQASVWIVAHLAEGLDHAHERGLLHRDLKPANVLVAADGTPMLLDFNLAAESECAEREDSEEGPLSRAVLGGTLPYMAPEHLDAFDPEGSTRPEQVDERSDLYALGLILFEMVSGERPFPEPAPDLPSIEAIRTLRAARQSRPVPSIRERCPDVPWSLDALVCRCLDPDPDLRYQNAHDLAEDLHRFLDDLPMKHCPEPSLRERAGKWARRNPTLCSSTSIAAAGVFLLALFSIAGLWIYDQTLGLQAQKNLQELKREFSDVQFLLNTAGRREETIRRGIVQANAMLHRQGVPDPGPGETSATGRAFKEADWTRRLSPEEQQGVRRDLMELLMLEARETVTLAELRGWPEETAWAVHRAIRRLDQAEQLDTALPSALFRDRADYHKRLGNLEEADRDHARAATLRPRNSRDWTLQGISRLKQGDLYGAERDLWRAIASDVSSPWAWFLMGHCHYEQGRYADAVGDFHASVVCGPNHAWTYLNWGLALNRVGRFVDAKFAFDRAVELDPHLVEARVNRGIVELELNQDWQALADLQAAVAEGCREIGAIAALADLYLRHGQAEEANALFDELLSRDPHDAVALVARGMTRLRRDPDAAGRDFRLVLVHEPRNAMAHYGMARLIRATDRPSALKHLDQALEAEPDLMDALQLRALERARAGNRTALDDIERLVRIPTPDHLYNAACALAILGETTHEEAQLARAAEVLGLALRAGFPAARAVRDPDLKSLAGRPDFASLIGHCQRDGEIPENQKRPTGAPTGEVPNVGSQPDRPGSPSP